MPNLSLKYSKTIGFVKKSYKIVVLTVKKMLY